jgi:hypothetical protein
MKHKHVASTWHWMQAAGLRETPAQPLIFAATVLPYPLVRQIARDSANHPIAISRQQKASNQ